MAEKKMFSATGNQMVADAFRQVNPDVMAAYPITPQTTIVEGYAKFVADGKVTTESEHSALSACIGASAAGARVATATSSQGLAYMWEELHIASGMRCPIVMANANRALSAPINIHGDHSDIMSARDCGWGMMFAETAQEAYDNTIIAFKVAEDQCSASRSHHSRWLCYHACYGLLRDGRRSGSKRFRRQLRAEVPSSRYRKSCWPRHVCNAWQRLHEVQAHRASRARQCHGSF